MTPHLFQTFKLRAVYKILSYSFLCCSAFGLFAGEHTVTDFIVQKQSVSATVSVLGNHLMHKAITIWYHGSK
jgi:hypothetical protein